MSKKKTKKVLTPEQKKKRIRNIVIVAVILVAASVAGVVGVDRLHHPRVPALCHKLSRADVSNHHRHEQQD